MHAEVQERLNLEQSLRNALALASSSFTINR